jgi:hypothetical protein
VYLHVWAGGKEHSFFLSPKTPHTMTSKVENERLYSLFLSPSCIMQSHVYSNMPTPHHHIHREMEQPPGDDAVALLAGFVMAAAR